ncbi:MAG: DNA-binding protein [Candidatus Handelsmanbacteria bacterium RIFCSPLOWO2_12_FULL_64_10]|uniref:Viral histone-like protein n=1 Tax=Handelsmanbacteria sp. (strain RIFCSPLOWO2_12_FULL_64_10) TaxID=1817868 RepID=A0A1F6D408_HANXR|nr:MAG: DNA-binding protein [Candidatus Handelsmanbacteria bacterium RIFCSPLOWO2_12_FULL_64_10]
MAKKPAAIKKPLTKSQILAELSENTGVAKKDAAAVLDELGNLVERHIQKGAAGQFTLPGLLKVKAVKRPAQPARKGVPNPFKPGEMMNIPAKPASVRVRVLPLKKLKDMVK